MSNSSPIKKRMNFKKCAEVYVASDGTKIFKFKCNLCDSFFKIKELHKHVFQDHKECFIKKKGKEAMETETGRNEEEIELADSISDENEEEKPQSTSAKIQLDTKTASDLLTKALPILENVVEAAPQKKPTLKKNVTDSKVPLKRRPSENALIDKNTNLVGVCKGNTKKKQYKLPEYLLMSDDNKENIDPNIIPYTFADKSKYKKRTLAEKLQLTNIEKQAFPTKEQLYMLPVKLDDLPPDTAFPAIRDDNATNGRSSPSACSSVSEVASLATLANNSLSAHGSSSTIVSGISTDAVEQQSSGDEVKPVSSSQLTQKPK